MRFLSVKHMGLREKLLLFFTLFILAPIITAGIFIYISSEQYVEERIHKETLQTLSLLNQNVNRLLAGYESQLNYVYDHEDIIKQLAEERGASSMPDDSINRYLRDSVRGKDDIESIYLFPLNKPSFYFYDNKGSGLFKEMYDQNLDWKRSLDAHAKGVIWFPTYRMLPNQYYTANSYYFMVGLQIRNVFDVLQPIGSVMMNLKIGALDHIAEDIRASNNGFLLIADASGNVIWHHNPDSMGENIQQTAFFQNVQKHKANFNSQELNGKQYKISYVQSEYNQWYYISFVPYVDILAETAYLKKFIVLTVVISGFIFLLLAGLTTIYIAKPLRRMVLAMKNINKDNLQIQFNPDSRDEIGVLQHAYNNMNNKIVRLVEEVRMVTLKEKEAELRAIRAQINPHFVYNTLDTINWMAIEKQENDISSMITSLSDIMRYAIKPGETTATIEEELIWVKNYLYVQKTRYEDRFNVSFEVDERVLKCWIPRLLLQPYMENAILHGLEDVEEGGEIAVVIRLNEEESMIVFEIRDNGKGMDEATLQHVRERRSESIGIYNMDDRLKLEFGAGFGVSIESIAGTGTRVAIIVPYVKTQGQSDV
ncbi:sensor histidine kinase [Paenibacillus psychroresistens]|uniref:Sensor histidine kinase n=1 Tax=Paenibacillus psychroresistens TaxID=1778678 RepID=A0A6B8RQV0_9BACL|nr:sensor histidine kinase [Paenibacillus psychroresistens]QGQ98184.1 sensor histidine kinase [Paenibacillus psychroresistens]